jgi:hypothetical protein
MIVVDVHQDFLNLDDFPPLPFFGCLRMGIGKEFNLSVVTL